MYLTTFTFRGGLSAHPHYTWVLPHNAIVVGALSKVPPAILHHTNLDPLASLCAPHVATTHPVELVEEAPPLRAVCLGLGRLDPPSVEVLLELKHTKRGLAIRATRQLHPPFHVLNGLDVIKLHVVSPPRIYLSNMEG
jgi:hypothetical protein